MPLDNPRAVPGANQAPDYAQQVTERLSEDYRGLTRALDELKAEAEAFPRGVNSDEEALARGAVIKKGRDLDSRIEGVRVLEKEPYLRSGNAVDSFFGAMKDLIFKPKNQRAAKPGLMDVLQADINDYQERKIAEERARLEAERREAERIRREAEEAARKAAAEAAERAAAAERARKAENIAARQREAEEAQRAADAARAEQQRQAEIAEEARLATLVKPGDIARVRGADQSGAGVTLTVAKEAYAILTDRDMVDMNMLRPYFTTAEIEKALRGWAKSTGHRVKMNGAEIGFRNKGVTR